MIKIAKIVFKLIKSEIRSSIYAKSHLALLLCIKIIIKRCRSPPAFNFKNLKLNGGREMKERKNYLLESLSVDEDKYIKVSIKKAYLKFIRDNFKDLKMKEYSIEDVNIQDKLPIIEEKYFYENLYRVELWNLEHKYSKKQQDICVQKLNSMALQFGIEKYIRTLTYNEKLVFFLLNIQCLSMNKASFLIGVDWKTIKRRKESADKKIEEVKKNNGNRL